MFHLKIDRLLAITMLLVNRDRLTAKELADHFEVSTRTIYRDMDAINQAGIPIVSHQGVAGGFSVLDTYRLDRHILAPNDVSTIVTALQSVNTPLADHQIAAALEKVQDLLGEGERERIEKANRRMVIDLSPWGDKPKNQSKLDQCRQAIEESRVLSFYYTNANGVSGQREVEPISMVFKEYCWYLHAYCRSRDQFRTFRLSRIREMCLENKNFVPRNQVIERLDWDDDPLIIPIVDLVLHFSASARVRVMDYFEEAEHEVLADESVVVRLSCPDDMNTYAMVLSYGDDVEILEPTHVRKIVGEMALRVWKRYCQ